MSYMFKNVAAAYRWVERNAVGECCLLSYNTVFGTNRLYVAFLVFSRVSPSFGKGWQACSINAWEVGREIAK